jgi:Fe2+ or Zn2+ uptake regulation protein
MNQKMKLLNIYFALNFFSDQTMVLKVNQRNEQDFTETFKNLNDLSILFVIESKTAKFKNETTLQ